MFHTFAEAWLKSVQFGLASAVTIGARLPMIAEAAAHPHRRPDPELTRMVAEKAAAMIEGAAAAQVAFAGLAFAAARGAGPVEMARRGAGVMEAAVAPARKRARANARRLTKTR